MITLRRLTKADIPACRALWQARFLDSDAFCDWYFRDRFCPELSIGLFEDGMPRSMAHGRRMRLRFGNVAVPVLMIGGVSTAFACEGRGYMKQVMAEMRHLGLTEGVPLLILATETPALYQSSGYTICSKPLYAAADGGDPQPLCFDTAAYDVNGLVDCCQTAGERYRFFPLRTATEMQDRINELCSDGAGLLVLHNSDGKINGYAFCDPNGKRADEVLARSIDAYRMLLSQLPAGTIAMLPPNLPFDSTQDSSAKIMCLPLNEARLPDGWNTGIAFCPETF